MEALRDTPSAIRATSSLALLIDGENLSSVHADRLLQEAARFGPAVIKRVYGNAAKIPQWESNRAFRFIHSHSGKNAADMLLTIEAVDLAHSNSIDTFVIATSDGDFGHLAHFLRERHRVVVGIGESKTPDRFRDACTEFIKIEQPDMLDQALRSMIILDADPRGMLISEVNASVRRKYEVKIREMPERNWRTYFLNRTHLYDCDAKGPDARVRNAATA